MYGSNPEIYTSNGTGHYWILLKIFVAIKLTLESNGELLIVENNVRNSSL